MIVSMQHGPQLRDRVGDTVEMNIIMMIIKFISIALVKTNVTQCFKAITEIKIHRTVRIKHEDKMTR